MTAATRYPSRACHARARALAMAAGADHLHSPCSDVREGPLKGVFPSARPPSHALLGNPNRTCERGSAPAARPP
eukprot:6658999-Pyramimonas_sp.AAC.1